MEAMTWMTTGYGQTAETEASWSQLQVRHGRRVRWLWPGRVPLGKLTLLVGDPGRGKSLLAVDMAARVTRGAAWPDGSRRLDIAGGGGTTGCAPEGRVVLLSAEDDAEDTILPRVQAAGGDPDRVIVLDALRRRQDNRPVPFSLSRHLSLLDSEMRARGDVRLVILDPVTAFLGGAPSHGNSQVRELLAPVRELAENRQAAVVGVSHLTKRSHAALMYRAMGSLAFVAAARAVWAVGPDRHKPGRMLLLPVKCNLAGGVTGLAFRIVPWTQNPGVPVLSWEPEPIEAMVEDALDARLPRVSRLDAAVAWLEGLLTTGPMASTLVEALGRHAGHSQPTLKRARNILGVVATHGEPGTTWVLSLPLQEAECSKTGPSECPMSPPLPAVEQ